MAYRNFSEPTFAGTLPTSLSDNDAHRLSPLERTTVLLSMHDGRCSLGQARRFDRVIGALFGITRPSRLADVRLEALRRYAVLLRLEGDAIDPAEAVGLQDLGFGAGQILAVKALLSHAM